MQIKDSKAILISHKGEKPTELNIIAHGGPERIGSMYAGNLIGLKGLAANTPIKITLYSCNTGYGSKNIAQDLSALFPESTVYAPNAEWRPGYGRDNFSPTVDAENGLSIFLIAVPNGWFGLGFKEFKNGSQQ